MIVITFNGLVAVRQRELEIFLTRRHEMAGDGLFGIIVRQKTPKFHSSRNLRLISQPRAWLNTDYFSSVSQLMEYDKLYDLGEDLYQIMKHPSVVFRYLHLDKQPSYSVRPCSLNIPTYLSIELQSMVQYEV